MHTTANKNTSLIAGEDILFAYVSRYTPVPQSPALGIKAIFQLVRLARQLTVELRPAVRPALYVVSFAKSLRQQSSFTAGRETAAHVGGKALRGGNTAKLNKTLACHAGDKSGNAITTCAESAHGLSRVCAVGASQAPPEACVCRKFNLWGADWERKHSTLAAALMTTRESDFAVLTFRAISLLAQHLGER
jgi:hypothetical protein